VDESQLSKTDDSERLEEAMALMQTQVELLE